MTLKPPFIITARLLPGLRIGDAFLSLAGVTKGEVENCLGARLRAGFILDLPDSVTFENNDLQTGCGGGTIESMFENFLCFLGAAADSYRYRGLDWEKIGPDDNATMFPRHVTEWAYQNSDEISMLQCEIEEGEDLITQ
jgi:hypothetical protein